MASINVGDTVEVHLIAGDGKLDGVALGHWTTHPGDSKVFEAKGGRVLWMEKVGSRARGYCAFLTVLLPDGNSLTARAPLSEVAPIPRRSAKRQAEFNTKVWPLIDGRPEAVARRHAELPTAWERLDSTLDDEEEDKS